MPTGYQGEALKWSKLQQRWVKKDKAEAFDYAKSDPKTVGFLISFFRWWPDYFADCFRSPDAQYTLELPQRLMMRLFARYRNVFITGARGLTKTYVLILTKMIEGILYPGEIVRYCAPNQKQAATIATQAFHQLEKDYPVIAAMWQIRNDRADMFRITTIHGSEITMYAPRGSNASQSCAEEIAQEGDDPFDMQKYEADILPTVRLIRNINRKPDRTHIHLKHSHITNASSRVNRAFSEHRSKALKDMLTGDKYEGYVADISWVSALLCNIRDISYIKDQKAKLTPNNWLREMCARYTGDGTNPMITDEALARSRHLMLMETEHCADPNAIYIVAHDVSYVDNAHNAKCADVVLKLTEYTTLNKRDKYRKQVVYVDSFPPPKTAFLQAQKLKHLWLRFCADGAQTTYLVVDAQAYGTEIVEELMKPSADGTPPLCCVNHMKYTEIEQPHALPVIYPLKSGPRGTADPEGEMIQYAQVEFENGDVELLTGNILEGIDAYKKYHDIKDEYTDGKIKLPYAYSDEMCQQIANLQVEASGLSLKEKRKSKYIQRDMWSALKYALRFAQKLETELKRERYQSQSSWGELIRNFKPATLSYSPRSKNNLLRGRRLHR